MTPADILAAFLVMFPVYQERICEFRQTSARGITVTLHEGQELHFVYYDEDDWTLVSRKARA